MFGAVATGMIHGVEAYIAQVEAEVCDGLPSLHIEGLYSSTSREFAECVKTALLGFNIPLSKRKVTINISPAGARSNVRSALLPSALLLLSCFGVFPQEKLDRVFVAGALSLSGETVHVNGIYPMVQKAFTEGYRVCIVPFCDVAEARCVPGMTVYGVKGLRDALGFLLEGCYEDPDLASSVEKNEEEGSEKGVVEDFADIAGLEKAKRAIEIAAAGHHHMLMSGAPGSGKNLLAKRIPTILPWLDADEKKEVMNIYSVAGLADCIDNLPKMRPFVAPHHTITSTAFAGGGRLPSPGVVSLSHKGVLFMDDLTEFSREVQEHLRIPMDTKSVEIVRTAGTSRYPADFYLVGAITPCPCGFKGRSDKCRCTDMEVKRHRQKILGFVSDKIDVFADVDMGYQDTKKKPETSADIALRVRKARDIQKKRFAKTARRFNSEMNYADIEKFCFLTDDANAFLDKLFEKTGPSARVYYRLLRVARTIADLDEAKEIGVKHLQEAAGLTVGTDKESMMVKDFISEDGSVCVAG